MLGLQEISDRLEIQQLAVDYANAIDAREFDRLDAVFAPDAYLDYRVFGGIDGRYPEVKNWLKQVLTSLPSFQHLVGNMDIRVMADRATGRILCLNPMTVPSPQGAVQAAFYGLWYIDTYVRTPLGWRIQTRVEERSFKYDLLLR
jgi:hypothetical protein